MCWGPTHHGGTSHQFTPLMHGLCIAELAGRVLETMEKGSKIPRFESNSALRS